MNIALGALIITILLLPGAIILRAYYTSLREKDKELHIPFPEQLFRGLVFSFFVHVTALGILKLFGTEFNFKLLYQITIADKFPIDNASFSRGFLQFGLYNFCVLAILFVLTKFIKRVVVDNNYDIKFHSLKTSNYWFLIFSARYLDETKKGRKDKTDLIWIDVMVSEDMVYSGYLYDFEYSPVKDELETITLKNASKRTYKKTDSVEVGLEDHPLKLDTPRPIQGDAFVILAKDVSNINLYYINIETLNVEIDSKEPSPNHST